MAELRIRVGAYIDRSFDATLRSVEQAAIRAQRKVQQEAQATEAVVVKTSRRRASAEEKAAKDGAKAQERAAKEAAKANTEAAKATNAARKALMKEWQAEADATVRSAKASTAAIVAVAKAASGSFDGAMRAANAHGSQAERRMTRLMTMQRAVAAQNPLFREYQFTPAARAVGRGFSAGARVAGRVGRAALGIAGDIAQGAGVDFSLGGHVARNADLEERAMQLVNSGYMPGAAGANGRRQSAGNIAGDARSVAMQTGFSSNDLIEGLQKFVGKTGDLETGRTIMKDLAVLSKATGTNLEDMVDAAGDVSTQLGDIPDKGAVIAAVMKQIAGQGKLGAVEIKDLATQMAKIASQAGQIEGNVADNIALLGAFAQESRQRGGSASATQAATSVQSMMNTFKTPARVAAFKAQGINVFNNQGMVRNPQEILMEALHAQGMSPTGFKKMFANVQGARAVEGFATIYRQAGGGQRGEDAVTQEFDKLKKVAMQETEIAESFAAAMKTSKSQATIFNEKLGLVVQTLSDSVMPAFAAIGPGLIAMLTDGSSWLKRFMGVDVIESVNKTGDATGRGIKDVTALEKLGNKAADEATGQKTFTQAEADAVNGMGEDVAAMDAQIAANKAQVASIKKRNSWYTPFENKNRNDQVNVLDQNTKWLEQQRSELAGQRDWLQQLMSDGTIKVKVVNEPAGGGPPAKNPAAVSGPGNEAPPPP